MQKQFLIVFPTDVAKTPPTTSSASDFVIAKAASVSNTTILFLSPRPHPCGQPACSWPQTKNQGPHGRNCSVANTGARFSILITSRFVSSSSVAVNSARPHMTPSTMTKTSSSVVQAVMGSPLSSKKSISRESWDRESNWIGNIASTSDKTSEALGRREIYVAWRGTTRGYEWINVFDPKLESVEPLLRDKQNDGNNSSNSGSGDENEKQPKVMFGWLTLYISDDPRSPFTKLSARAQLLGKIKELKERYKGENISIVFTGHSLGASLATLSAFDVVESGIVDDIPVGNKAFDERTKRYPNFRILHTRNTTTLASC
ncbi:hypothetical protein V6N13_038789 [Hibiscus sabdariffa]